MEASHPKKLFEKAGETNQEAKAEAQSSSENDSASSENNVKTSVSQDIVIPVKIRRAKRQLNLGLSSSPVQRISLGKHSPSHSKTAESGTPCGDSLQQRGSIASARDKESDSSGKVLRRSPRKPKQPSKMNL